jgi:hypothetical protein
MAIKTFTTGEVLTAADTNTYLANSGLVYLETLTITNATSGFTDTAFTSAYKNYRIVGTFSSTTALNLVLTFRNSGGDVTLTNYKNVYAFLTYGATPTWTLGGATAAANFSEFARTDTNGAESAVVADVMGPNTATRTNLISSCTDQVLTRTMNGIYNADTAMLGFKLSSGTAFTGSFRIYGYRQA